MLCRCHNFFCIFFSESNIDFNNTQSQQKEKTVYNIFDNIYMFLGTKNRANTNLQDSQ